MSSLAVSPSKESQIKHDNAEENKDKFKQPTLFTDRNCGIFFGVITTIILWIDVAYTGLLFIFTFPVNVLFGFCLSLFFQNQKIRMLKFIFLSSLCSTLVVYPTLLELVMYPVAYAKNNVEVEPVYFLVGFWCMPVAVYVTLCFGIGVFVAVIVKRIRTGAKRKV